MLDQNLFDNLNYVLDWDGNKVAVQVDVQAWEMLLAYLEDLEDRALIREKLARLRQGPDTSGAPAGKDAGEEW